MKCLDCLFYSEEDKAENDKCLHKSAETFVEGVRKDMVVSHYKCVDMLSFVCRKHKLFQPRLGAA